MVAGLCTGGGNSNPLQHRCLENPINRGAWRATVHRVTKESDTTGATEHPHMQGLSNLERHDIMMFKGMRMHRDLQLDSW